MHLKKFVPYLIASFLVVCFTVVNIYAQHRSHPFGLVSSPELEQVRSRLSEAPYSQMLDELIAREEMERTLEGGFGRDRVLVKIHTYLYALTGDKVWSQKAYSGIEKIAEDTSFVNNPFSFGLTRAAFLRDLSLAYDFCYPAWEYSQRKLVADVVYQLMLSVNASMGIQANTRLESNWMGVRWGSVLLASVILNDSLNETLGRRDALLAHTWDTRERLRDHIRFAYTPNGWYVETLGYQLYKGSFVWPAMIAYQNTNPGRIQFDDIFPNFMGSYQQHITGTIALPSHSGVGIRPDLANDNAMSVFHQWPFWIRLLPDETKPMVRWMHDYIIKGGSIDNSWEFFYSFLFTLPDIESINPAEKGYLNYLDETQGVIMFRNRFQDANDIVATFNTSAKRFGGHAGPDNLTFRITGLGNIWAVGIGRTGDPTGQTLLFPATENIEVPNPIPSGKLLDVMLNQYTGCGYALGYGSCVGVDEHYRYFAVDYSPESKAEGVFVVMDNSRNGKIWRMHTPGFNIVEVVDDGVIITAPNESTMKISLPDMDKPDINIGQIRYGGNTERHNPGIGFHGQRYYHNHLIDIQSNENILVVITLQKAGNPHPVVLFEDRNQELRVGNKIFSLPSIADK